MARRRPRRRRRTRNRAPHAPRRDRGDVLFFRGQVEEALPNATFRTRAENGMTVLATLSGRLRRNRIRVLLGDAVSLEVSAYDPTRGRIVYRHRPNEARRAADAA